MKASRKERKLGRAAVALLAKRERAVDLGHDRQFVTLTVQIQKVTERRMAYIRKRYRRQTRHRNMETQTWLRKQAGRLAIPQHTAETVAAISSAWNEG